MGYEQHKKTSAWDDSRFGGSGYPRFGLSTGLSPRRSGCNGLGVLRAAWRQSRAGGTRFNSVALKSSSTEAESECEPSSGAVCPEAQVVLKRKGLTRCGADRDQPILSAYIRTCGAAVSQLDSPCSAHRPAAPQKPHSISLPFPARQMIQDAS